MGGRVGLAADFEDRLRRGDDGLEDHADRQAAGVVEPRETTLRLLSATWCRAASPYRC